MREEKNGKVMEMEIFDWISLGVAISPLITFAFLPNSSLLSTSKCSNSPDLYLLVRIDLRRNVLFTTIL